MSKLRNVTTTAKPLRYTPTTEVNTEIYTSLLLTENPGSIKLIKLPQSHPCIWIVASKDK